MFRSIDSRAERPARAALGTSAERGLVPRNELLATADILGLRRIRLSEYPDGGLGDMSRASPRLGDRGRPRGRPTRGPRAGRGHRPPPIERCLRGDRLRPESVNGCSSAADVARLTHVHNDYVIGGLELARRAGAAYVLSAGDEVAYEHIGANDGDEFAVGELVMRAVHTPGHARYQAPSI